VKTRIVVPDQRNVPLMAGVTWKNGGRSGDGIRPRDTIGSEKTTRISRACARVCTSPVGPALTTVSPADCGEADTGMTAGPAQIAESPATASSPRRIEAFMMPIRYARIAPGDRPIDTGRAAQGVKRGGGPGEASCRVEATVCSFTVVWRRGGSGRIGVWPTDAS
jgi:hypothetical protein